MKKYLAIDMGGTAIKFGVLDEELNFSVHGKIDARTQSMDDLIADLSEIYNK